MLSKRKPVVRNRRVKTSGRRHISTPGLASSGPRTFLFCHIVVYFVVFRPEWPHCRPRRLGNRSGRPVSFARYYFRFAHRRFVAYSATPITTSVEEFMEYDSVVVFLAVGPVRIEQNFSSFHIDKPVVGRNAISKNANNVVISGRRVFIF